METIGAPSDKLADDNNSKLSCDELIRLELKGKFLAVERYDSILWKIRSGYILVLYGALTLLGGTGLNIAPSPDSNRVLRAVLMLVWGFSVCGLTIDLGFLLSKLRVVADTNALYDLALDSATGKIDLKTEDKKLRDLLQISGESAKPVKWPTLWNALRWVILLYLVTPIFGTVIYALLRS